VWTLSRRIATAALVTGVLTIPLAIIPLPEGASAAKGVAPVQATRRADPRWALNRQLHLVVWPASAQVSPEKAGEVQVFVAVLNSQDRPVGVQSTLRLGIGICAEGRRQDGHPLDSTIPRYRVVLKREDFLWLPPDHLYGVRVSPAKIFPELVKEGDYLLSFQYANPYRVDMGKGRLPFLGYTEEVVVRIKVLGTTSGPSVP